MSNQPEQWRMSGAYYTNTSDTWEIEGTAEEIVVQLSELIGAALVVWSFGPLTDKTYRPKLVGWRCDGGHEHKTDEKCPDDYIPDEQRPYIFENVEVEDDEA